MGDLEQAVTADLESWGLAESGIGAAAIDIARRLGSGGISPTGAAMLHAQLNKALADLRKLAPEEETSDEIDEVRQQRERRRAAAGMA